MLVDTTIQIIQQALVLCNINYNLKSLVFRNITFLNIAIKITYFRVFLYHSTSFVTTCKQVAREYAQYIHVFTTENTPQMHGETIVFIV